MNAYSNQANHIAPARSGIAVGQRVKTIYGIGIITDVVTKFHRGFGAALDPQIVTIIVPGNPPHIFQQSYQTLVFSDSVVGGEVSIGGQWNANL